MPKRFLLVLRQQVIGLWAFVLLLFSSLIISWAHKLLPSPQALIALLSIKLFSMSTILLTAAVLFILFYFYRRHEGKKFLIQIKASKNLQKIAEDRLVEEKLLIQRKAEQDLEAEKLRIQRKVEKDLQEEKLLIQRKAEKDLEEEMLSTQRKVEKALSDFIYDIFESDLDDELKKIVEDSPIASGNNGGPLYILEGLIDYFKPDFRVAAIFFASAR